MAIIAFIAGNPFGTTCFDFGKLPNQTFLGYHSLFHVTEITECCTQRIKF